MTTRSTTLVFPTGVHRRVVDHLFPGDGLEAAALLLCTIVRGRRLKLLVQDVLVVPYAECALRAADAITWPGRRVEDAIARAEASGQTIIAIHSHPGSLFAFSMADDESDCVLMRALIHAGIEPCGSAIMTPDGAVLARIYGAAGQSTPVDLVTVVGDDLLYWWNSGSGSRGPASCPMAFTTAMADWLGRMSACIIGVSGTGSVVAEQLARLGIGELILIDFDRMEARNLNRIVNSTAADAADGRLKVEVVAEAIRLHRPNCEVRSVARSVATHEAVCAAAEADLLFSCVDSLEARHIADRLGAFMAMPLFDVGVSIPTRQTPCGVRVITEVCGRIDYVFPGGSTLLERGVYDGKGLEAEYLARVAPEAHRRRLAEGYLPGVREQAPDVIAVNMRAASTMVLEVLARAFPFRQFPNAERARTLFMLGDGEEEYASEPAFSRKCPFGVAAGLREPLLDLPSLSVRRDAA